MAVNGTHSTTSIIKFHAFLKNLGASGLAAARWLAQHEVRVTVLEARNRIGGRVNTDRSMGFPVEQGAHFIHGTFLILRTLAFIFCCAFMRRGRKLHNSGDNPTNPQSIICDDVHQPNILILLILGPSENPLTAIANTFGLVRALSRNLLYS